ncbi:MAG TPA: methylmalonyl-CoA mutase family protein [Marmoricola sp.]|nr:methylmalonyl-CoA mutase family protein [Marmoricola sp.]
MESPVRELALETGTPGSRAEWEEAAAAVLRKAGRLGEDAPASEVWARLARTTLDDIAVPPLGTPELVEGLTQGLGAPVSQRGDRWDNRPLFANPDAASTAREIVTDLENGATSVWIQVGAAGVPVDGLSTALGDVLLDAAPVVLDAPDDPIEAARAFADLASGTTPADGTTLGVDPIGSAARRGTDPQAVEDTVAEAGRIAGELGCRALVVDGTAVHDLGASDAQELGYVLAVAASYLRALTATGLGPAEAADLVEFRLAATDEQFPTIAKMRAARRLWARMLELCDVPAEQRDMRLHAVTSRPMMSRYDPWVNMLRTCVASFAAGVGGADAVTVLPFDAPIGLPDAFARRIARNTASVLVEESHVAKVADPAAGAYAVERLTADLARAAWAELDRTESGGGIGAALADGSLLQRVEAVAAERDREVALRQRPITGLTEFPNLAEAPLERTPYPEGALQVRSYGHAFEALRDDPPAQPVFLATMGTVAAHTARASFAGNLLGAGGIEVVNEGRHDDVDAVLSHYRGEQVVCLAGSDDAYAEWGTELAQRLREAGAEWVIVAGAPLEGTDDNCARGVDALDFVTRTREKLA